MLPHCAALSPTQVASLKQDAARLLADVKGVRSIGMAWDDAGAQVLRVDVSQGADRELVEARLQNLATGVAVREVSGRVFRD